MKEKFLQIYVISTCPNDLRRYGSRSNTMRVMYFWSEIALLETREKLFTYFYFRFFMLLSGHFHTVVWIKILLTLFFFWMSVYSNFKLRSNSPFSLFCSFNSYCSYHELSLYPTIKFKILNKTLSSMVSKLFKRSIKIVFFDDFFPRTYLFSQPSIYRMFCWVSHLKIILPGK